MNAGRFRRLVEQAVESLPEPFASRLDNVSLIVEREPALEDLEDAGLDEDEELFGLYVGIPLTERADYHMTLPDRILVFQGPHERHFSEAELPTEIRRTVVHEIAHFFGIADDRLEELGLD